MESPFCCLLHMFLQAGSISFLPPLCHYLPITNTYSIVNITWTRERVLAVGSPPTTLHSQNWPKHQLFSQQSVHHRNSALSQCNNNAHYGLMLPVFVWCMTTSLQCRCKTIKWWKQYLPHLKTVSVINIFYGYLMMCRGLYSCILTLLSMFYVLSNSWWCLNIMANLQALCSSFVLNETFYLRRVRGGKFL